MREKSRLNELFVLNDLQHQVTLLLNMDKSEVI